MSISPDVPYLAAPVDETARVWDATTPLAVLRGHSGYLISTVFTPSTSASASSPPVAEAAAGRLDQPHQRTARDDVVGAAASAVAVGAWLSGSVGAVGGGRRRWAGGAAWVAVGAIRA